MSRASNHTRSMKITCASSRHYHPTWVWPSKTRVSSMNLNFCSGRPNNAMPNLPPLTACNMHSLLNSICRSYMSWSAKKFVRFSMRKLLRLSPMISQLACYIINIMPGKVIACASIQFHWQISPCIWFATSSRFLLMRTGWTSWLLWVFSPGSSVAINFRKPHFLPPSWLVIRSVARSACKM